MFNFKIYLFTINILICSFLLDVFAQGENAPNVADKGVPKILGGPIVAVNDAKNSITIRAKSGDYSVVIGQKTAITAKENKISIADLKIGDYVTVNYLRFQNGERIAETIDNKSFVLKSVGVPAKVKATPQPIKQEEIKAPVETTPQPVKQEEVKAPVEATPQPVKQKEVKAPVEATPQPVKQEEVKAPVEATPQPVKDKVDLQFNGDAQFGFRYHYTIAKNVDGGDSSKAPDYSNRYAWNLKWKIDVSENLTFGIRLSNPSGYATDNIVNNIKQVSKSNFNVLSLPEMYFKWSVGMFSLAGGIIPVEANSVLNLIAYEPNELGTIPGSSPGFKNTRGNTWDPWNVITNNSQKGLAMGFDLIDTKNLTFGMNLVTAMAIDASAHNLVDAFLFDQVRFILSLPTSFMEKKLSLLPVMHVRTNAYRSLDHDHADHSVAGGCDVMYSPIEKLQFQVGAATGVYKNESQIGDVIDTDGDGTADFLIPQIAPFSVLTNAGISVSPGFGKADLFFAFVTVRDREQSPSLRSSTYYWDVKYGIPIKQLTIMPRCRIWYDTREDFDNNITMVRPELIFKAGF